MCVCVYPKAYEHELLSEEFEFFPIISICEHCVCVCAYPTTTLVLVVIDTNKTHFANLVARHYVATHCVCVCVCAAGRSAQSDSGGSR